MRNTKEHIFQAFLIPPALRRRKKDKRERERKEKQEKKKNKGRREKNQVLPWMLNLDQHYTTIPHFKNAISWMKLEPIIQSEVSQKDKDHYNILTHIYGI